MTDITNRANSQTERQHYTRPISGFQRRRLDDFLHDWKREIRVDWPRCSPIWRPEVRS